MQDTGGVIAKNDFFFLQQHAEQRLVLGIDISTPTYFRHLQLDQLYVNRVVGHPQQKTSLHMEQVVKHTRYRSHLAVQHQVIQ